MPGAVNGRSLADEALRKQPKLKVLFTTGYTRNAIVHHGRLDPGIHLLTKPYSFQQLALKVGSDWTQKKKPMADTTDQVMKALFAPARRRVPQIMDELRSWAAPGKILSFGRVMSPLALFVGCSSRKAKSSRQRGLAR
jgi:hypothetical protein